MAKKKTSMEDIARELFKVEKEMEEVEEKEKEIKRKIKKKRVKRKKPKAKVKKKKKEKAKKVRKVKKKKKKEKPRKKIKKIKPKKRKPKKRKVRKAVPKKEAVKVTEKVEKAVRLAKPMKPKVPKPPGVKPRPKIPTSIKGLDTLLSGGIPEGTSFLIYGTPHCGKKPMLMQIAYSALKKGIPVIFLLTDFGVVRWKGLMRRGNWNVDRYPGRVYFIDCYSAQFGTCPLAENVKCMHVPYPLSALSIETSKIIDELKENGKKPMVVLHSVSTLINAFGDEEVFKFLQFFIGKLSAEKVTSIFSLQYGMHDEKVTTMTLSLMDGIVEMKDSKLRARGFFDIRSQAWVDYRVTKKGVDIYYEAYG